MTQNQLSDAEIRETLAKRFKEIDAELNAGLSMHPKIRTVKLGLLEKYATSIFQLDQKLGLSQAAVGDTEELTEYRRLIGDVCHMADLGKEGKLSSAFLAAHEVMHEYERKRMDLKQAMQCLKDNVAGKGFGAHQK